MKLTFLGAAGEVTGSQHLVETDSLRVLLDCGLFQGRRSECRAKNEQFHCDPRSLDGVILSHAHIDHSGNLPGLYKAGFRGTIFCTEPTADIVSIMLRDSAKIQQEDAKYLRRKANKHNKKGKKKSAKRRGPSIEPLYTESDARAVTKLLQPLNYDEWHELADDVRVRFTDAGHILGSALVELELHDEGEPRRVVFTGDLGRREKPILKPPTPLGGCDVLICESTYGNRVHPPAADIRGKLKEVLTQAWENDGRVIIPAFSLGRTQMVVYYLNELRNANEIPPIPVFVDSPLAVRLTDVFRDHHSVMNADVQEILEYDDDAFDFEGLTYVQSQQESVALNRRSGAFVVISASGMCENGRVVHHLKHAIGRPENTILIIGFQAQHTLGRRLVERRERVRIFDREYELKAKVEKINGLSAHADADDFRWWFEKLAEAGGARNVFLVHGEPNSAADLAEVIRDYCDEDPIIPQRFDTYEV